MVFVGDDAFPLSVNCTKPFSKKSLSDAARVFNYRVSRFRRISENAFGIWINRFSLFATKAALKPGKVEIVALASLVLHNMLRTLSRTSYTPVDFVDSEAEDGTIVPGSWREVSEPTSNPSLRVKIN